jgi:hypothetical protein
MGFLGIKGLGPVRLNSDEVLTCALTPTGRVRLLAVVGALRGEEFASRMSRNLGLGACAPAATFIAGL